MTPGEVEIIVVPNGADDSWRKSLLSYKNNSSVRVVPVNEANANIARNAGLAEAKGEFVRFLDDDDYLIPEGAKKQYELIRTSGADIVSGSVNLKNASGRSIDIWHQPEIEDLCAAVLGPWRVCLPVAHVYKRSTIKNFKWNPETPGRQDVEWLLNLCGAMELRWEKIDGIVGIWQHHWGQRISSSKHFKKIRNKLTAQMLIKTYTDLKKSDRLNKSRLNAISIGLWNLVHGAFFLEPNYWSQIAHLSSLIDPSAKPPQPFYKFPGIRNFDPLIVQWIMLPKRLLSFQIKQLLRRLQLRDM